MYIPLIYFRAYIKKMLPLHLPLILFFASCQKQSGNNSPNSYTKIELAFKTNEWAAYPYEDGSYSYWSPQINYVPVLESLNIEKVYIKTKSGLLWYAAPTELMAQGNKIFKYYYQFGKSLARPQQLLLWWSQEQPGEKPDADSVFITIQY